jgi:hypothetical protein
LPTLCTRSPIATAAGQAIATPAMLTSWRARNPRAPPASRARSGQAQSPRGHDLSVVTMLVPTTENCTESGNKSSRSIEIRSPKRVGEHAKTHGGKHRLAWVRARLHRDIAGGRSISTARGLTVPATIRALPRITIAPTAPPPPAPALPGMPV